MSLPTFLIIKIAQSKPKIIILVGLKRIVRHDQILFLFLVKPNILDWMLYLYFYRSHINIKSASPKFFELVLYTHWLNDRVEGSGGHVFFWETGIQKMIEESNFELIISWYITLVCEAVFYSTWWPYGLNPYDLITLWLFFWTWCVCLGWASVFSDFFFFLAREQ